VIAAISFPRVREVVSNWAAGETSERGKAEIWFEFLEN
jgi:hypothetical protein